MKTSKRGLDLIKKFEGLYLQTYLCPSKIPTIGYGTTNINGRKVPMGLTITKEEAENYLEIDLIFFERSLNRLIGATDIKQNQYDALIAFSYNCGVQALKSSTLFRLVRENPNNPEIRNQFMRWVRSNGTVLNGLVRRRKAEADLYFLN
jgi:lysozyme